MKEFRFPKNALLRRLAAFVFAGCSPLAGAADAVIGLNFCDQSATPHISGGTADGFSAWIDSRAVGDATSAGVQTTPLALGASGVSVTWSASNAWGGGSQGNKEQALYRIYLDDGGSGVRVTISGLSAWLAANGKAAYRIRCYAASDYATSFMPISIHSGADASGPVLHAMSPPVLGNGDYPTPVTLPTGLGPARGYVDSPSTLTDDTITLTIPARYSSGARGTLAAFKITAPALPPVASTLAATNVTDVEATLNGTANGNGDVANVSFQYGTTTSYGSTVVATPASVTGITATAVSGVIAGLSANTTYHYRAVATGSAGTSYGPDRTFKTNQPAVVTLTPNPIAFSVRSGESASMAMVLANTGAGTTYWTSEVTDGNNRAENLEGALAAIDGSGTTLNAPLPSRFDFSEGETGTFINSGDTTGSSIFSQGNKLTTSLGGPLGYSNGVVASSSTLGSGGRYFTRKLPGLFIFAGDLNGPSWFEVAGTFTYGNSRQTSEFSVIRNGKRWSVFVSKTADYWRTINQMILVDQDGLSQTTSTNVSNEQQRVSGLAGKRRVYYLLFATSNTTVQPDSVFEDLAGRLLNTVPLPLNSMMAVAPPSGTSLANSTTPLSATANAMGLPEGTYALKLNVKTTAGAVLSTVPATLEVTAPRLTLPATISQTAVPGMMPITVEVPMSSNLPDAQPWSASIPSAPAWLGVVTSAGTTPEPLKLRFDAGTLAAGTYRSAVRITTGPATFEIPVVFTIAPLAITKILPDPLRPLVYALNSNGNEAGTLLVMDAATHKVTRSITLGRRPTDIDLSADAARCYAINTLDKTITEINLAGLVVEATHALPVYTDWDSTVTHGHVRAGKGNVLYYVDGQWGPRLHVFDKASGTVLQTFGASSSGSANDDGIGGLVVSPDGSRILTWNQYGWSAGSNGTSVSRFKVNADGTLTFEARTTSSALTNFARDPLTTPALMTGDGSRLIVKDRAFDPANLADVKMIYPDEIHSITPGGELAAGESAVYSGSTASTLYTLPVTTSVQAMMPDYSAMVYFNPTTKAVGWLDLAATIGYGPMGLAVAPADGSVVAQPTQLRWLPSIGVYQYQVYLGTDRAEVESATPDSPTYLGTTSSPWITLSTAWVPGQGYFWRVVPLDSTGTAIGTGTTRAFTASQIVLSRTSIDAAGVSGAKTLPQTIQLTASSPQSWSAGSDVPWITFISGSGATPSELKAVLSATNLAAGLHQGNITITGGGSSFKIPVSFRVYAANYMLAKADLEQPFVYVVSQENNNSTLPSFLLRVNTATNQIETSIPCGRSVTSMSIHYAENRIYLTNWYGAVLRAFDRNTLAEVQSYPFSPVGSVGYGGGDNFVVAAGRSGRIMVEDYDQWIDVRLYDTASGAKLASSSQRQGGGLFEPLGRYYYHGDDNSSGAMLRKLDTSRDLLAEVASKRVSSYSYYGSRLVAMSGDGSRVFWNGGVFDPSLNVLMQLTEEVVESTYHGELLFTNTKAINGSNSQVLATLPVDTKVQAVSADQKKLFLFKAGAMSVVNLSTITTLPPRGLNPGIADGSTVIGTSQELSWSLEAAALSYDVYFGSSAAAVSAATKDSAEYLGNTVGTTWTGSLPPLSLGSTYYWRVDMNSFSTTTKGSTWSFGIAAVDVAPRAVSFSVPAGSPVPRQSLAMTAGAATAWTASTTTPWISLVSTSGSTPGTLQFDINTGGQSVGTKNGAITLQAAGKSFTVPVELTIVTLNVTKLVTHPNRPVVYAIHTAAAGEGVCHLLEINSATATIQRTLPIGFGPTDADLDPVNERLYVSNWGYSQTRVIDVAAWAELPALSLGEDIYKLEITPNGRLVTEGEDQWISLNLWNPATGGKLATASTVREGDGQADPTGGFYYHCDNNSSGAILRKYNIAADTFVQSIAGPQIGYGSRNLVLSGDGKRLFWLGRTLDENLKVLATMPSNGEVYATNRTGELAVGDSAIWWSDSGTQLASLPFASTVAAVSSNDTYLVRFNATTRTLQSTAIATLTDLPGSWPRPGQILNESPQRLSWTPVAGATAYRVYIAADATALQAMTAATATVTTPYYDLPAPLEFGRFFTWRVDAVVAAAVTTGKVQSFSVRFPQGPVLALSSIASGAGAASFGDRGLLLGFGNYSSGAQLYGFDPATGDTTAVQNFSIPGSYYDHYFGCAVALDAGKAAVGAYTRDNPADGGGNAYLFLQGSNGYWETSGPLAPPTPAANEGFGLGLAASGNLMLAGTSNTYSLTGRVVAYVTEPAAIKTQVFSATDGAGGDAFGKVIVMDGNRAVISAPGDGSSNFRIPCLYAFSRSTATGLWSQSQKIAIPGASASSVAGGALALSGTLMATRASSTGVAIYTETGANQWTYSTTISNTAVTGASSSFGSGLALHGDMLFIGDPNATYSGTSGGAVFTFRRSGSSWVQGPVLTPDASRNGFGQALAARDGWLLVAGTVDDRPAAIFRIQENANSTPRFMPGIPNQVVAGRPFTVPVRAEDGNGNEGLAITKLQGPSWLTVTDNGNGEAVLSGTPSGASGSVQLIQLGVRDAANVQTLWTYQLTILAPTDVPTLTQEPANTDLGEGQELVLRAAVSGIGPFQWQWYRNGEPINGANRDSLVIGEVSLADAGNYRVRVSNVVGEDLSADALLTVHQANRYAGDWPTFGSSPAHTGRHPAALDACHFVPTWTRTVQSGRWLNRAAIADGRAVVVPQGYFVNDLAAKAFDLSSGAPLWSFAFPSSYSSNPPSVFNGRVYFQRGKGTGDVPQLFCLNAASGAQIWASTYGAQWESYEAPAITEKGIFINGGAYGGIYGFNFDGTQRFFQGLPQNDGWTPTLSNGRLFSWVGGTFIEHNPADGTTLWSLAGQSGTGVTAVQGDAAVLLGSGVRCVDLSTRSLRWQVAGNFSGRPAIAAGRVFGIQGNTVRGYSLANGSPGPVYQTNSSGTLLDQPILFNDRLVISSDVKTWVFNLEDGQLLQTLDVGGRLSYSNSYLLIAGSDGILRAFRALHYNANLANLALNQGTLLPAFDPSTTDYITTVPFTTDNVALTPTTEQSDAIVKVNGTAVASGAASNAIDLPVGNTTIPVVVTAEDGITIKTYTITVTRLPREFVFNSAGDVPVTANGFAAGGHPVNIVLNDAPAPGTILTMVNNTGLGFIAGRFGNLDQGQRVTLNFGGNAYDFVANYYGGTGNDLVLQWADARLFAWGSNSYGQLGNATTSQRLVPSPVNDAGVLSGKTITAVAGAYLHSLALCSDGSLAAWGYNVFGQLGNDGSASSNVPVAVDRSGALAGKTVVAISVGPFHNLALCSDGTVVAWGYNNYGQLGTGDKVTSRLPVRVNPLGALAGKSVVGIAAGAYHSFALCSDGTVAGWGYNEDGELGDGSVNTTLVPVMVNASGSLSGRKVASLAAGQYHTLALCTDGTLHAWGYNKNGQLGDNSTVSRKFPVAIGSFGALAGKTVSAISAGASHSMATCSDGSLAVWGLNSKGQLGSGGLSQSVVPVPLVHAALAGGRGILLGASHSMVVTSAGTLYGWGDNASGQLGNNSTVPSASPLPWDAGSIEPGMRLMSAASGASSQHAFAIMAGLNSVKPSAAAQVDGAISQDSDHDGITDLLEYAFGLNPNLADAGGIPQAAWSDGCMEFRFVQPAGVVGVLYSAEWSASLKAGEWFEIPDQGTGSEHIFRMPAHIGGRGFMRLKVTRP